MAASCMTLVSTGAGCGIFSWAQPRAVGGRSSSRDGGGGEPVIHPSARRLEGVMHRRRCWLKVWCTTKLGLGRRHIRLVDADTVHVLLFSSWGARGCPQSIISCDPRDHLDCDAAGELSCGQKALSGARGHRAPVSGQYLQLLVSSTSSSFPNHSEPCRNMPKLVMSKEHGPPANSWGSPVRNESWVPSSSRALGTRQ